MVMELEKNFDLEVYSEKFIYNFVYFFLFLYLLMICMIKESILLC